jgi:BolA family transcriptional regulator, general stress-responsive regulator
MLAQRNPDQRDYRELSQMTAVAERIRQKLSHALTPSRLVVTDESHRHAGHVGARREGETHFRVEITSARFAGMSRIDRQRLVHDVLAEELRHPVHALSLATTSPEEADAG